MKHFSTVAIYFFSLTSTPRVFSVSISVLESSYYIKNHYINKVCWWLCFLPKTNILQKRLSLLWGRIWGWGRTDFGGGGDVEVTKRRGLRQVTSGAPRVGGWRAHMAAVISCNWERHLGKRRQILERRDKSAAKRAEGCPGCGSLGLLVWTSDTWKNKREVSFWRTLWWESGRLSLSLRTRVSFSLFPFLHPTKETQKQGSLHLKTFEPVLNVQCMLSGRREV